MTVIDIAELENELSYYPDNNEVLVEVNGVQHQIHEVQETSQGVILIVDKDQEEREMR